MVRTAPRTGSAWRSPLQQRRTVYSTPKQARQTCSASWYFHLEMIKLCAVLPPSAALQEWCSQTGKQRKAALEARQLLEGQDTGRQRCKLGHDRHAVPPDGDVLAHDKHLHEGEHLSCPSTPPASRAWLQLAPVLGMHTPGAWPCVQSAGQGAVGRAPDTVLQLA